MSQMEIKEITKTFKNETVLDGIRLSCSGGHIYGITGRNGSGKTVLFKILCGLMLPDSGSVCIDGKYVGKDMDFPDSMGIMIENPGFMWFQSGYSNLSYLAGIKNKIGKKEIREVIQKVGLDPDSRKRVGKYSLGMKQRLGIAQAIMEDPEIIILDEPMNGLDEHGVDQMRQLFLELKAQGKLIILASHNKEDIGILCDEVYHLNGGRLKMITPGSDENGGEDDGSV